MSFRAAHRSPRYALLACARVTGLGRTGTEWRQGQASGATLGVKARSRLAVARAEHSRLAAAGVRVPLAAALADHHEADDDGA